MFFVFRQLGGAVGAFTTHSDDIPGRGEPAVPAKIREFLERRFGTTKLQGSPFAHVGMESSKESYLSVNLIQEEFTQNLRLLHTFPGLSPARQQIFSPGAIKLRQCKLGFRFHDRTFLVALREVPIG